MKKRIFCGLALISVLAVAGGFLLGWAAGRFGFPLLPWPCAGAAVLLGLLALLGAAVSSRAVRRTLRPIEEFSEHLDRDGPAGEDGADKELLPVLEKIRERQRTLRRRIEELTDDRDAIRIITENMQRELEQQRENFSANASQLRTPIASVSGLAEQIGTGAAAGEEARRLAGLITRESARLLTLIDDMIRFSRLDGAAPVPMARLSLTAVCREALTNLSLVAHRRGVGLKLIGPEVWVRGNAEMLGELIANLCENAVKYNREGGSVLAETGSDPSAGTVWVAVRDTGVGIPEESFQRVFERFYRVDNGCAAGGTGLGLSIAKRLADFHQGTISLESTLGEGSVFTVTLPAWKEENTPQSAPAAPARASSGMGR